MFMGHEHGCLKSHLCSQPVFMVDVLDTREYAPWTRAPVHTTRVHGPCSRVSKTSTVNMGCVYRALVIFQADTATMLTRCKQITECNNKMLSYRRETALQGAL